MTTQYLVRKIETCPVCKGEKHLIDPDWQRINRENNEWMQDHHIPTFTDAAQADWERRIKETWPYHKPPPEEYPCDECEGSGKIESWLSLADALRELGVMTGLAVQELA